ncbi:unnamed protein product [Sphagnum balticum]
MLHHDVEESAVQTVETTHLIQQRAWFPTRFLPAGGDLTCEDCGIFVTDLDQYDSGSLHVYPCVFMASQPSLLPCGLWKTIGGMVIRFGVAPAIMAIASVAVGIRGNSLRFAITQAAFPQGIMTFVLAKEYNMHADIFATA